MKPSLSCTRQPFTMLELLCVIIIIIILAAILLPALHQARQRTRTLVCMSTMRQMGVATVTYAYDNKLVLPMPNSDDCDERYNWYNALDRYLSVSNTTPNSVAERNHAPVKHDPIWASFPEDEQDDNRSIKMNFYLKFWGGVTDAHISWLRVDRVRCEPSNTIMYVDGRAMDLVDGSRRTEAKKFGATPGLVGVRHRQWRGANVVLFDGHVETAVEPINTGLSVPGWHLPDVGAGNSFYWKPWEETGWD